MNARKEENILLQAIVEYGAEAQTDMMIEKMSELTKALLKHRRKESEETLDNAGRASERDMKTEMTRTIEQAIVEWNPAQIGDIKVNKFRAHHTGLEVPAECGTTTCGIVDAVRVSEYFGDIITTHLCGMGRWKARTGSDI